MFITPIYSTYHKKMPNKQNQVNFAHPQKAEDINFGHFKKSFIQKLKAFHTKHIKKCIYCGEPTIKQHTDHMNPKKNGGSDKGVNAMIICDSCNCSKGSDSVSDFINRKNLDKNEVSKRAKEYFDTFHNSENPKIKRYGRKSALRFWRWFSAGSGEK